jgi:non-ribosomal peptide synthetase component F
VLDSALLGRLKLKAAQHGCTMFTLLLAAYMMMIHRQSRLRHIVVGTPSAGQSLMGGHNLIGYCINTLPIRSRISEDQSFADYLKSIRRRVLDAYDHQNYSLYRLVKELRLVRDPSRHPLVSISFNMDRLGAKPELADLRVEILENPRAFATFDLSWNVVETSEKLYVDCVYNSDLFNSARSKTWMAVYELLLDKISESSDITVADLLAVIDEATRKNHAARENAFKRNRQETLRGTRRQTVGQQ